MSDLLTICVLTYERPEFLRECLESILAQTFEDYRLVVLHNPGSANYNGVINEFKDPRIKYVKHEKNIGGVANFLKAANECNSKYILIFHDDDLMHPRLIEFEIDSMERTEDMQFTATNFTYFKGEKPLFPHIVLPHERLFENGADFTLSLLSGMRIAFSSVMYRSAALRRLELDQLQRRFGRIFDRPILVELACQGPSEWLQSQLVLVRDHPNQDSASLREMGADNFVDMASYYRDILQERWNSESARIFYVYTGFLFSHIYRHHDPIDKNSFHKLINKFRSARLVNIPITLLCFLWSESRHRLLQCLKFILPRNVRRSLKRLFGL